MEDDKTKRIRELNDDFRKYPQADPRGQMVMTRGIADLSPDDRLAILNRVRDFDEFTEDNDPHGEHDFGAFDYQGQKIFWKIDYYDLDMKYHSPDNTDPKQTARVLTVMFASEY